MSALVKLRAWRMPGEMAMSSYDTIPESALMVLMMVCACEACLIYDRKHKTMILHSQ